MALSQTQIVDYLFKKVGFSISKTDVSTAKQPFNETIASPLLTPGQYLWQQDYAIPNISSAPSANVVVGGTTVVSTYNTSTGAVVQATVLTESITNETWSTGITNWIPPSFGSGYQLKLYAGPSGASAATAAQYINLPVGGTGANDSWFFDYQSGIINFGDTIVPTAVTGANVVYAFGSVYSGAIGVTSWANLTVAGNITSTNGNIVLTNGNIFLANGNIVLTNGYYVGNISGAAGSSNASGNANVAAYTTITPLSNNQTYYVEFANIATAGNSITGVYGGLSYNPGTNTLVAGSINAGTIGNVGASGAFGTIIASTVNAATIGNTNAILTGANVTVTNGYIGTVNAGTVQAATIGNTGAAFTGSSATLTATLIATTVNALTIGNTGAALTGATANVGSATVNATLIANTVNAVTLGNTGANVNGTGTYLTALNPNNIAGTVATANAAIYTGITSAGSGTYYPLLSGQNNNGNVQATFNSSLNYNTTTGALTATSFNGTLAATNVSGTVATANIALYHNILSASSSSTYFLTFANATSGNSTINTVTTVNVNPGTSTIFAASVNATSAALNSLILSGADNNGTQFSSGALQITGGAGISGNLYVSGNVYTGNLISTTTQILEVSDPLVYLNASNPATYNYEIGLYSHFGPNANFSYQHTGLARDHNDYTWKFFSNVPEPSNGTVNLTNAIYDMIKAGNLILANSFNATSTTTGVLQVAGGAGIQGNLWAGNVNAQNIQSSGIFIGSGLGLTAVPGSSVTGTVTTANSAVYTGITNTSSGTYYPLLSGQSTTSNVLSAVNASLNYNAATGTLSTPTVIATTVNAATIGNIGANLVGTGTYLTALSGGNITTGSIPNSALTNSSITVSQGTGITVSGSPVALGGTVTITNAGVVSVNSTGAGNLTLTGTGTGPYTGTVTVALPATGPGAINVGSSTSVPTIVTDAYGRIVSLTSNAISTSFTASGTTGTTTVSGGSTLTFSSTNGVTIAVGGTYANISTPQDVRTTASPNFASTTLSGTLIATTVNAATIGNTGAVFSGASETLSGTLIAATVNAATIGNTGAVLTGTSITATNGYIGTVNATTVQATTIGNTGAAFTGSSATLTATVIAQTISAATIGNTNAQFTGGNLTLSQWANVTGTTTSTSTSTGALVVGGGAGIAGNLYVGGNIVTSGTNGNISGVNTLYTSTVIAQTINAATLGNTGANVNGTGTYLTALTAQNVNGTVNTANVAYYAATQTASSNSNYYLTFANATTGNSTINTTTAVNVNPSTGNVSATAFVATNFYGSGQYLTNISISALSGTYPTANVALFEQLTNSASNATYYIPFYDKATGNATAYTNTTVNVNPSTGTISASAFSGAISSAMVTTALGYTPYNSTNPAGYQTSAGSVNSATYATQASTVAISATTTSSVYYPIFVPSNTTTAQYEYVDGNNYLQYNPGTGNLATKIMTVLGNLTVSNASIFNTGQSSGQDYIVRGVKDSTLLWARPNNTYDTVIVGNSATASTVVNGAKLLINSTDSMVLPIGTSAQRPTASGLGTDTAGMFRYNSTGNYIEWYNGTAWANPSLGFTVISDQQFTGTGSQTAFTLSSSQTTASCIVSINGVVQIPTLAYSVSGVTLTFTEAPQSTDVIDVRMLTTTTTTTYLSDTSGYNTTNVSATGIQFTTGTSSATTQYTIDTNGGFVTNGSNVTIASAGTSTIDNLYANSYSSAKYTITATLSGTTIREVTEVLMVHNGSAAGAGSAYVSSYGRVNTAGNTLVTYSGTTSGNIAQLQATTTNANTILRIKRDYMAI